MKVNSDLEVTRLEDGNYQLINVIEQILNKKEMLNLVKTRSSMKEKSNNKIKDLEIRKKNIARDVKNFEKETKAKIEEEIKAMKESINFDTIDKEIVALETAIKGDKEIAKLDKQLNKLIVEYSKKQEKLKKESEKNSLVLQGALNKI